MAKKPGATSSAKLLRAQPDEFWEAVHVFPKIIRGGTDIKDYKAQALSQLNKCRITNLKLLCERALLPLPDDDLPQHLSATLISADRHSTLIYLSDFVRGRGQAINEEYESHFKPGARTKHLAHLGELGKGREGLRQLVKLLLLYESDEKTIPRIFVRKLWRSRRSTAEFATAKPLDARLVRKIEKSQNSLADALSNAFSGFELRSFGNIQVGNWSILLLQREYAPTVRPDYRNTQSTLHGYGWVMLGMEQGQQRILLKGGGQKAIEFVSRWFQHKAKVELSAPENEIFKDYDGSIVEDRLLGDYPDDAPIQLAAMGFRRTLAPQHSPITVEPSFPGQDIRSDLQFGREHNLFRIRSLSDVAWFRIRHQEHEARVEVSVEPAGATILRLDNTDLPEESVDQCRRDFQQQFGVPLDRRIDPQILAMGVVEIYNYLLEAERTEGLLNYQHRALDRLVDKGVVTLEPRDVSSCPKQPFICKLGGQPVMDEDVAECPECQSQLDVRSVEFIEHNDAIIRRIVGELLSDATGWQFSSSPVQFENEVFYPLSDPDRPDRQIRVYFAKRVGSRLLSSLDRSLQPVLVVHTGGDVEHAHLDAAGVAHLSFARALAVSDEEEIAEQFSADARRARDDLIRRQEERVYRRAAAARAAIAQPPHDYSGEAYERDVFSVIRSIFFYAEYWAGPNKPDGFCSLVYFDEGSLRKPVKFNWSYDAKFTRSTAGYNLNAAEERKLWDYVTALFKQPQLSVQGNELNAHVIVSNNISTPQMKSAAQFVRREHRLGKDHPNTHIVFMMDEFLSHLYDDVRTDELLYKTRWNWLPKRLAQMMSHENTDGYVLLDAGASRDLCLWVRKQPQVDNPPDLDLLRESLKETMTES